MTVGERLVQLREDQGFKTRKEFAKEIGIPETTLRNYEKNEREPGHTFLKKMSEYFNVSVDYILGLTDEKEVLKQLKLNSNEQSLIEKYRCLDEHGKDIADTVIEKEYLRCMDEEKNTVVIDRDFLKGLPIEERLGLLGEEEEVEIRRVARKK